MMNRVKIFRDGFIAIYHDKRRNECQNFPRKELLSDKKNMVGRVENEENENKKGAASHPYNLQPLD